ncbi:MAG: hypothetical protein WA268_18755 [Xanthobacteraceae bacterium]
MGAENGLVFGILPLCRRIRRAYDGMEAGYRDGAFLGNGKGRYMKPGIAKLGLAAALTLAFSAGEIATASAQAPQAPPGASPCNGFLPLRNEAQKRGMAIGMAEKQHADRKQVCKLVTAFSTAEEKALKFLQANMVWCGVPQQAITAAKDAHLKTVKFREAACAPAPEPHLPTLSDAIGTPTLDTAKNTKANTGTFNTLTGNPLDK